MSLFGSSSPQPLPGITSTPPVTRSNPDRRRREQRPDERDHPRRGDDSAELSHHDEAGPDQPQPGRAPPADDHPHIDVQG